MKKRNFKKDDEGQIFSLDVMMALIMITVLLGVSADAMDMVSYKAQEYSLRFSLERVTTDAADMLIKSPGSPDEWENWGFSINTVPGLAKKEFPNTLSLVKILKLKDNYNQFIYGKILPEGVNSSMIIYPANPSLKPIIIMNNTILTGTCEVAVANRTVLCEFIHVVTGINTHPNQEWSSQQEICPHADHNGHGELWKCCHFDIRAADLNSSDFYIITDAANINNSARWGIDKADTQIDCREAFNIGPTLINDKIAASMSNDTKTVLWFHILTKEDSKEGFNGYIVSVPKGTPLDQVRSDYLGPQPCFFVLHVWY